MKFPRLLVLVPLTLALLVAWTSVGNAQCASMSGYPLQGQFVDTYQHNLSCIGSVCAIHVFGIIRSGPWAGYVIENQGEGPHMCTNINGQGTGTLPADNTRLCYNAPGGAGFADPTTRWTGSNYINATDGFGAGYSRVSNNCSGFLSQLFQEGSSQYYPSANVLTMPFHHLNTPGTCNMTPMDPYSSPGNFGYWEISRFDTSGLFGCAGNACIRDFSDLNSGDPGENYAEVDGWPTYQTPPPGGGGGPPPAG